MTAAALQRADMVDGLPATSPAPLRPLMSIRRLRLQDFRNYGRLELDLGPEHVVLVGENGAGKTNLLEALSLLSPGRGFRRATLDEMTRK